MISKHSHRFVEEYGGDVLFGMDRKTDEEALAVYLQKFSDDDLLRTILPRLKGAELDSLFEMVSALLRAHLSEPEYHALFLKSEEP